MNIKLLLKAIPFELERSISSQLNSRLGRRPSSEPFLSGDTFRKHADAIYDETYRCSVSEIRDNDVIFVKTDYLHEFYDNVIQSLKVPVTITAHNSDYQIDESYRDILDHAQVRKVFSENACIQHEKLVPLPIGLENQAKHNAGHCHDFKKLRKKNIPKKNAILMAFTLGTNPVKRFECYKTLYRLPFVSQLPPVTNSRTYRKVLAGHMFVASPPGNGPDCHRTWEAMYLGAVPIVEDNHMNRYFASLGLPLLLVKDWSEINEWTETTIARKYREILDRSDTQALWSDYWLKRIRE